MTTGARTDPEAADARLRGRTYHVPFEDVWQAARALADRGQRGWTLLTADDQEGVILARATVLLRRTIDDVRITIRLDEDAQTRVDVRAAPRAGGRDFGRNRRRIARFLERLDREVPRAAERRRQGA